MPSVSELERLEVEAEAETAGKAGFNLPEGYNWMDLSDEEWRIYYYPDPYRPDNLVKIRVLKPLFLATKSDQRGDSHRIVVADGGVYIPRGWIGVQWKVKEGQDPVAF